MAMLEKLMAAYEHTCAMGNGGFGVGYYADKDKTVAKRYEFKHGAFELILQNRDYFSWHYKPDDYPAYLEALTCKESTPQTMNLAFFASGTGSNAAAILASIDAGRLDASPKIMFTNRSDARVISIADKRGLPLLVVNAKTYRERCDEVVLGLLRDFEVTHVVLAGYLKKMSKMLVDAYPERILNIHPSLLPRHGGKGMFGSRVHQAVLDAGDAISGPSVHVVTEEYDDGQILGQRIVRVSDGDTAATLASRVLTAEHLLYTNVLKGIQQGKILT